jgi:cellulose synthase/poly-beta-1,6-N-acetylglucosamine synthase-like glycosyltransferase
MGRPISSGWFSREVPLNWNKWLRQIHRWLSIVFTATVIANFVAMGFGQSPPWVVYAPLLPLALLLFTGLYLFALPYAANRGSGPKEEKRA